MPRDGNRYEVVDGDLYVTPSPTRAHQRASWRLERALGAQLEDHGVAVVYHAPFDLIVAPMRAVQPDIMVVRHDRQGIVTERGVEGSPDLVLEILSDDQRYDREIKRKLYASIGVPEYWIVDPGSHTVEVLTLADAELGVVATYGPRARARSATLPFEIEIDELFSG